MKPKIILYVAILLVFLVSISCNNSGLSAMVTERHIIETTSAPRVNIPTPRINNPTATSGLVQFNCEDVPLPEGYTHQDCYWIDESWNTFGVLYYTSSGIKAIATFTAYNAPSDVVQKSAYWSADAAHWATWNSQDAIKCASALSDMQSGDSVNCGSISVTAFISQDGSYKVIYFVQH